jgi:hypothetical protein
LRECEIFERATDLNDADGVGLPDLHSSRCEELSEIGDAELRHLSTLGMVQAAGSRCLYSLDLYQTIKVTPKLFCVNSQGIHTHRLNIPTEINKFVTRREKIQRRTETAMIPLVMTLIYVLASTHMQRDLNLHFAEIQS